MPSSDFASKTKSPSFSASSGVEIVADEAEIVLVAADFARALEAVLLDDALPHRESEVIRD